MTCDAHFGVSEQEHASVPRRGDARVLFEQSRWRGSMYLTESAVDIDALKKRILDGLRAGRFGSAGDLVDVSEGVSLLIGVSLEEVKAI